MASTRVQACLLPRVLPSGIHASCFVTQRYLCPGILAQPTQEAPPPPPPQRIVWPRPLGHLFPTVGTQRRQGWGSPPCEGSPFAGASASPSPGRPSRPQDGGDRPRLDLRSRASRGTCSVSDELSSCLMGCSRVPAHASPTQYSVRGTSWAEGFERAARWTSRQPLRQGDRPGVGGGGSFTDRWSQFKPRTRAPH